MRARVLTFVAAALLLAACGVKLPPIDTPEPPKKKCPGACPLGTECKDSARGCEAIPAPGPTCVEGQTNSCWHWPSDSKTWLYACPVYNESGGIVGVTNVAEGPAQCPTKPPIEPPPSTDCRPVLDSALSAPVAEDGTWPRAADQSLPSAWKEAVWDAVRRAKQACPEAWSGDCAAQGPAGIDRGYLLISRELQRMGVAASQGRTPGGEVKDHLWVRRSPNSSDWNATKLFFYGNGCLITGDGAFNVHGWYTYSGVIPPVEPPPVDPPAVGCTAPLPPKVWTAETLPDGWGEGDIGKPRWEIGCEMHPNGRIVNCSAKVAPRACAYCDSIGMGAYADGQLRCGCPVRNECKEPDGTSQNFKCEERRACEKYLTGGTRLDARNGATCEFANDNPFLFYPSGGNCRLCSVGDPRVCGGWF